MATAYFSPNWKCAPLPTQAAWPFMPAMRAIAPGEEITFDYAIADGSAWASPH